MNGRESGYEDWKRKHNKIIRLSICAGQEVGSESATHAIHSVFEANETETILLVDEGNAIIYWIKEYY